METNKPRGLGRGLDALFANTTNVSQPDDVITQDISFGTTDDTLRKTEILYIDINKITPNPNQPRTSFDKDKLEELSESIKIHGLIQPILVKKLSDGYEIIAGERRWRASRNAGLKQIPCILKEYDESSLLLVALIENMQREDLNPLEEAKAFDHMANHFGLTQDEIAKNIGKSRPYVTNQLRLLKLPDTIKELVSDGAITTGHARALLSLETMDQQLTIAKQIVTKDLSVRQVEELVSSLLEAKKEKETPIEAKYPELFSIENEMKDILGAKVKINQKKDKGKIEISFFNRDELERLIELLLNLKE